MAAKSASIEPSQSLTALRTISFRLSSTPKKQLPLAVPQLITLLEACQATFLASDDAKSRRSAESLALHKYCTQVSTFLKAKSIEERWTAVVLIKSTVELGGVRVLKLHQDWVRGLLNILSGAAPPNTKQLCIMTLTRIFLFLETSPTLVREVVTPSLPAFVNACLNVIDLPKHSLGPLRTSMLVEYYEVVLGAFCQLIRLHSNVFRAFVPRLRKIVLLLIFQSLPGGDHNMSDSNGHRTSAASIEAACSLFVHLNDCSPRAQAPQLWLETMLSVVTEIRKTTAIVYNAGGEKFDSGLATAQHSSITSNDMDLSNVSGIESGCVRLCALLGLLGEHFSTPTCSSIVLPVGHTIELLHQIMSVVVPLKSESSHTRSLPLLDHVSQEERQQLWLCLPQIHVAVLQVFDIMCRRLQKSVRPFILATIDHVDWIFRHENFSPRIRATIYRLITILTNEAGPTLSKGTTRQLSDLIEAACDDLETLESVSDRYQAGPDIDKSDRLAESLDSSSRKDIDRYSGYRLPRSSSMDMKNTVLNLLSVILLNVRPEHMSQSFRSRLDRLVVLMQHEMGLCASVLNPPTDKKFGKAVSSLLPLMARAYPATQKVEGILRPRIPVVQTSNQFPFRLVSTNENDEKKSSLDIGDTQPWVERQAIDDGSPPELGQSYSHPAVSDADNRTVCESADVSMPSFVPNKRTNSATDVPDTSLKRARIGSSDDVPEVARLTSIKSSTDGQSSVEKNSDYVALFPSSTLNMSNVDKRTEDSDDEEFEIPQLTIAPDTDDEEYDRPEELL